MSSKDDTDGLREMGMPRSKDAKIELLANVPLFWACSKKELGQIASLTDEYTAQAGHVLTKEGKPGGECFVIAEGKATVTLRGKQLSKLGPGDVFGEMSLLDHGPRTATITADTDMVLFVLDPRSFDSLLDEHPGVSRKIMKALAQRLRNIEAAPTYYSLRRCAAAGAASRRACARLSAVPP